MTGTAGKVRRADRLAFLASWFESEEGRGEWLRADWEDVERTTRDVYGSDAFDDVGRFAIVEKLELPAHDGEDVLVDFQDDESAACARVADLFAACGESSWVPLVVLDLDEKRTRTFKLSASLAPLAESAADKSRDEIEPGEWTGSYARRRGSKLVHRYRKGPPHDYSMCGKLLGMSCVTGPRKPDESACPDCLDESECGHEGKIDPATGKDICVKCGGEFPGTVTP